jgi:hypothetical protein
MPAESPSSQLLASETETKLNAPPILRQLQKDRKTDLYFSLISTVRLPEDACRFAMAAFLAPLFALPSLKGAHASSTEGRKELRHVVRCSAMVPSACKVTLPWESADHVAQGALTTSYETCTVTEIDSELVPGLLRCKVDMGTQLSVVGTLLCRVSGLISLSDNAFSSLGTNLEFPRSMDTVRSKR